jgi:hypothetical protein
MLRYCTSSIPEGVSGIFYSPNPAGRPMALVTTQGLTEMSTGGISLRGVGELPMHRSNNLLSSLLSTVK